MSIELKKGKSEKDFILVCKKNYKFRDKHSLFNNEELAFIRSQIEQDKHLIEINQYKRHAFVLVADYMFGKKTAQKPVHDKYEAIRKSGNLISKTLNRFKRESVTVIDEANDKQAIVSVTEGLVLGNYQFLKYFREVEKKNNALKTIFLDTRHLTPKDFEKLKVVLEATCIARNFVNEPVSYMTATQLSKEFQKLGHDAGFAVEVYDKNKIESLRMGGLLAVNKGSVEPPTFNILEWKPKTPRNKKPFVLVGKGVVYDTGGLTLKPTPGSMDEMKSDKGGAVAVACAMYALAKCKIPIHVIGLIPATDNRPGGDAYTPGDVITHYDGTTTEVMNTDAEGRLILADALAYAKQYRPELVIDLATLTGACVRAIGMNASGMMGTADEKTKNELKKSGLRVFERLVEFPFWDDYAEMMKSDIADLKNISGSANAGAITAGKFLEHFTKNSDDQPAYPWIHLDIAGPAFLTVADSYRGKGATGVGVRLLFDFLTGKAG